jgi:FixJ family two-component response regulator
MSPGQISEAVVFIVHGDLSTRLWVEATVTSAGLRVLSFDSCAQVLSCVSPGAIACAVLDVKLPDGSGFELQANLVHAGVATLFLTRERCFSACVRAVKAGAVDYLVMPCTSLALIQVLRIALRQAFIARTQRVQLDEFRSRYELLTARERQVFALVSRGLRNKQIAHQLNISQVTVQIHRGQVMKKMAARSIAALVRMADALQPNENATDAGADAAVNCGKSERLPVAVSPAAALTCR